MNKRRRDSGFTLIELLITLAISVVLLSLAVPSFRSLVTSSAMTSEANEFLTALNFTRSEAVKRNLRVTLCKSSSGTACTTSGGWQQGWIIFVNSAANGAAGTVNAGDEILRVRRAFSSRSTLIGQTAVASFVSYLPNGIAAQSGRWDLCSPDSAVMGRDIVLSTGSGYASVSKDDAPVSCDGT